MPYVTAAIDEIDLFADYEKTGLEMYVLSFINSPSTQYSPESFMTDISTWSSRTQYHPLLRLLENEKK